MVSVLRGGVSGCALVLCLTGLAGLPQPESDLTHDEEILKAARIGTRSADVLSFLKRQILDPELQAEAKTLIGQLHHDNFRIREAAAARLIQMGHGVLPLLEQAKTEGDLETRRRAERCAHAIAEANRPEVVSAVLRIISIHRPPGATKVLVDYIPVAQDAEIVEQVCDALLAIGIPDSSASKCMNEALSSNSAVQRGVVAHAIAQRGLPEQQSLAKKLLQDPSPTVRLWVARGLLARGDGDAVVALISLVSQPAPLGPDAEDILLSLAGDTAPRTVAAWREWWRTHQRTINLAKAATVGRQEPIARAKVAAERFLNALARSDFADFKRTVDIPFHLGGLVTFTVGDDFDQLFRQVLGDRDVEKKDFSFQIAGIGKFAEFRQNLGQLDMERLQSVDPRKLQVVYVQGRFGREPLEKGAVLVRLTATRALVIGIYQAPSN